MIVARFSNEMDTSLDLVVEPWATQVTIPKGSHFAVHYPPPADRVDTSHAEICGNMVRFWCEGDTFEIEIDGSLIET